MTNAPRLLWHLVEQSLDEAEFLWIRFDDALSSHRYSFADIERWVEPRLLGAIDGVRIAGVAAVDPLLSAAIRHYDASVRSVAAHVLAGLAQPAAERVLEVALREASSSDIGRYACAIGRAAQSSGLHSLWSRLQDASDVARAIVLEAFAFCAEAPSADWKALLHAPCAHLRKAAAGALQFAPARAREVYLPIGFDDADLDVRNRAIVAAVAGGSGVGWRLCLDLVRKPDAYSGPLLALAAALGSQREVERVVDAVARPAVARDALWALGFAGTVPAIEACVAHLATGPYARVAFEAFCACTGADARELTPSLAQTSQDDAGADSDNLDALLVPTGDELLPVPDAARVEQWWQRERSRFEASARYLGGRAFTLDRLRGALEHGPARRRSTLALELAARTAGRSAVQVLAFCRVQRGQLRPSTDWTPANLREAAAALGVQPLPAA